MHVPVAAVDLLSENLKNLPSHMVADVKDILSRLGTELTSIRQLIVEFSRYNPDSETLKQAVKEIKQILDETDDAVDFYVLESFVQKSRLVSRIYTSTQLRDLAKEIGSMAARVEQFNEDTSRRSLEVLQYQEISQLSRAGNSSQTEELVVEEERVIGFDKAVTDVAKLLVGGCQALEVISIAGMSGLGKTTLTRKVLKHPSVETMYKIHASVYVSRECDKTDVLRQILASITESKDASMVKENQLENRILEELKDKQYLIVLDDIWEVEDWDMLKGAFPNNQMRCRVLITTNNERVAEYANPKNPSSLHRLGFLNPEDSEELLKWRIFKNGDAFPSSTVKEYSKKIVQKCDGLPLALVLVAGTLANHRSREEWWETVASSIQDYVARASEDNKLIEIMYGYLSNHLKTCFLYFGVFREGSEIPVWKLVRLWVSEGFIEVGEDPNKREETAEKYLEELVQRNLVMVGRWRSNGKIKSCRIHKSILQFCKAKAMEENLFEDIHKDLSLSGNQSLDQCRRLCIDNATVKDYISGDVSGKRVRSFLTFGREDVSVEANGFAILAKNLKLVRVLEAQSLIFSGFPVATANLVFLKYLAISSDKLSTIPSTLAALWNLQTLIVSTESGTLDIKADLWKMPQFRHLHTNKPASLPSPGVKRQKPKGEEDDLAILQTLCTIAPGSCLKQVFDLTPKLNKLGIRGMFAKSGFLLQHLSGLESLRSLKLQIQDDNLTPRLPVKDLPRHLTELTLENTRLPWTDMFELAKLEKLEALKLNESAFQGKIWNCTEKDGFPSLVHLYIGRTDLKTWEVSGDHFPKLKRLMLNNTKDLGTFPPGLADISGLQSVALHNTNPVVAFSAGEQQTIKGNKSSSFRLTVYPPGHRFSST